MSQNTRTHWQLAIWDFGLTLRRWHLSHVHASLTSSCPPPFMCYHKIICFWQTGCWVTYAWPGSREAARKAVQSWRQASSSSAAHTHQKKKKRPLQSFPWFLFWAASVVSTVSQAPPKKWHILRPDAWDSQYRAVIISRALFFCLREGGGLFLTNAESLNILPPLEHTNHCCQILQGFGPDEGCLEGMAPIQSRETALCHYRQCYIYFLSVHVARS